MGCCLANLPSTGLMMQSAFEDGETMHFGGRQNSAGIVPLPVASCVALDNTSKAISSS